MVVGGDNNNSAIDAENENENENENEKKKKKKKIEGKVVLEDAVLGLIVKNQFRASLVERARELLGHGVSLQLVSSVHGHNGIYT